jgi:hypothetical protein
MEVPAPRPTSHTQGQRDRTASAGEDDSTSSRPIRDGLSVHPGEFDPNPSILTSTAPISQPYQSGFFNETRSDP